MAFMLWPSASPPVASRLGVTPSGVRFQIKLTKFENKNS
jgi:hypothetical protein